MNDKWLIAIDLDGTTLSEWNGKTGVNGKREESIHPLTLEGIKLAQEAGHVVVIATGRDYSETEKIYNQLGLNSFVINSAGARIHNPNDINFSPVNMGIPNTIIKEIFNDQFIKENASHYTVNEISQTHMKTFIQGDFDVETKKYRQCVEMDDGFAFDPQSSLVYFKETEHSSSVFIKYIEDKWGDIVNVTNWGTVDEGKTFGIELNSAECNKGTSTQKVAALLGIKPEHTMGVGDGENDIDLLKEVAVGVKMINGVDVLDKYKTHTTKLNNTEGGLGDFLIDFFKLK